MSANGGEENAATSAETTYFYFDLNPAGFEGALDRFSQFFIAPLFTESGTERELNAIENEHKKNLTSEARREHSVLKGCCAPGNPFHKFGTGNRDTLTAKPVSELREALMRHFDKYYTPKNMFLSLESAQSLEELEALTVKYFAAIPTRGGFDGHGGASPSVKGEPSVPLPTDENGQKHWILNYFPINDARKISVYWDIPGGPNERWRTSPFDYISNLLGHESDGSVLALLKKFGWATALCSGIETSYRTFEQFGCTVQLTEEGFKHWKDVVSIIYAYLGMLRSLEPSRDHFEELKIVDNLRYDFAPRQTPMNTVNQLSSFLANENPLDHFLTYGILLFDFDPEGIKKHLELLSPNNALVIVSAPELKEVCTETEKWYGARYSGPVFVPDDSQETWMTAFKHEFSSPLLKEFHLEELHIPAKNPFVPTLEGCAILAPQDLEVDATIPERVYDDDQCTCFWKQDRTFGEPKVIGRILLANDLARNSLHNYTCAILFKEVFAHTINDFMYMANIADTSASLTTNSRGIVIRLAGYSEKVSALAQQFLEALRDFVPPEGFFNMVKERLIEQSKAARNAPAYSLALSFARFHNCIYNPYSPLLIKDELVKISLDDLIAWSDQFRKTGARIVTFFQGNLTQETAIELTKLTSRTLKLPITTPDHILQNCFSLIPTGVVKVDMPRFGADRNNVICIRLANTIHEPEKYDVDNVYISLLKSYIEPLFFDEMRTNQQLGYVVWIISSSTYVVDSFDFVIQSSTHDPDYMLDRINEFRAKIPEMVEKITEEEFKDLVDAYVTELNIKDTSMSDNADNNWGEMISGSLDFRREKLLTALSKDCTREGFIAYAKKYLVPDAPGKREFITSIWGEFENQAEADAAGKKIVFADAKELLAKCMFPICRHTRHKILQMPPPQ